MADAQDISDLSELIARIGQDRVKNQASFVQKTAAIALPMEEDYEVPPAESRLSRPIALMKNQRGKKVVNVSMGGTAGLGSYDDGTARPAGSGRPITQGEKLQGLYAETLLFMLAEVDIADGGDAQTVNKVERTLKAHGSQFGAYMARALIDPSVDEPTLDVAAGQTTMVVQDATGYIEGQRYEVRVIATEVVTQEFVVLMVAPVFGGGATITFEAALTAALDVSEEAIYLKGQGDFGDPKHLGSLKDITDSTLDLYGLARATIFPAGIYQSVAGAWSNADGKEAHSSLSTRCNPTTWHCGVRMRDKIVNAQQDGVRFITGSSPSKGDPFADFMVPEFCGLPIVACPMAPDTRVTLGNFNSIEFREHVPYAPRKSLGVEKGEMGRGALRESEDLFAFKMLFDGWYSMATPCRRDFLTLDNITS
jgi:hypothetical protein